jgi:hypothetical protein
MFVPCKDSYYHTLTDNGNNIELKDVFEGSLLTFWTSSNVLAQFMPPYVQRLPSPQWRLFVLQAEIYGSFINVERKPPSPVAKTINSVDWDPLPAIGAFQSHFIDPYPMNTINYDSFYLSYWFSLS